MKTLPGILVALFDSLEKERREVQEDGVPFKRYFGPAPLRLAMAFARETALDEAAHIARGRLAGDEAGRFAARMIEKKRRPLFPGAPTSVKWRGERHQGRPHRASSRCLAALYVRWRQAVHVHGVRAALFQEPRRGAMIGTRNEGR